MNSVRAAFLAAALCPLAAVPAAAAHHDKIPFTVDMKHLPGNYRQLIAREFKTTVDYAGGIRDAQLTNPGPGRVGPLVNQELPTVCLRYRTGWILKMGNRIHVRVYYFRHGKIAGDHTLEFATNIGAIASSVHYPGMCAGRRAWSAFPEINHDLSKPR
jgi:hypothetical protein